MNDETPPSDDDRRGMVDDIIIEARIPSTPAGVGAGISDKLGGLLRP